VTLTWAEGAIRNTWLQVTVKPTIRTGLAAADVFYFGNLQGESGDALLNARVSALDLTAVRRALNQTAAIAGRVDFNRDGRVNALDLSAARSNLNRGIALIAPPPAAGTPAPAMVAAPVMPASGGTGVPAVFSSSTIEEDAEPSDLLS
jgi:hypothetical protein